MNKVVLMGRITRDIDVRQAGETSVARFTVAVDRQVRKDANNGQPTADFIGCVAFGKTAEFVSKYFSKGMKIALDGRIQTGSYEKNGQKVYTTDIIAEHVEFCESKNGGGNSGQATTQQNEGFMNIPDGVEDEGLPFN